MIQSPANEAETFQIARDITTPEARVAYLRQACRRTPCFVRSDTLQRRRETDR